ncbi:ferredoxin [Candidatus Woesearchaeota archaeon]|nr:ferredoxin [Candidatus Woesearchaeota archaeon]
MAYKVTVDDSCVGCGACQGAHDDIFKLEGDKAEPVKAKFDNVPEGLEDICPVGAIKVEKV